MPHLQVPLLCATFAVVNDIDRKYGAIDVAKFLLAATVAIEHCNPDFPNPFGKWVQWTVFTLAVPFFFVAVGFFLQRSLAAEGADAQAVLRRRFNRAARMMLTWLAVYLPLVVVDAWLNDAPWTRDLTSYIFNVVIHGEPTWGWPLWFVYAMMIGVGLVWLWHTRRWPMIWLWLLGITTALYAGCYVPLRLSDLFGERVGYYLLLVSGHTLYGLLPILLGMWLFRQQERNVPAWVPALALVALAPLAFKRIPLAAVAESVVLFYCALRLRLPNSRVTDLLRRLSRWVYFVHIIFVFIAAQLAAAGLMPALSNTLTMLAIVTATMVAAIALDVITARR